MTDLVVQKFGGSVLKDHDTFVDAARHIADTVHRDRKVVAVVSAQAGLTDRLL
ncbi:MAG: aspartate kinase, partial [Planctomycetes bacterium]|nr:aspartate kinase [Planctomycetota bacterium]